MKSYLVFLTILTLSISTKAQEIKMPLGRNVLLNNTEKTATSQLNNNNKPLNKITALSIPFAEYFNNNSSKPNINNWDDDLVEINSSNAIFNTINDQGAIYNIGYGQADFFTTNQFNTTNAGNAFILINYSTGANWQIDDSLVLQVKGNNGTWNNLWVSNNAVNTNKDVLFNINFIADLKSNLLQFRFVSYCNTNTIKNEVFKLHQFIISYKNSFPLYEPFRQFNSSTLNPINTQWIGYTNEVTPNDSNIMHWGNSTIFNAITNTKDSSYFNNNGLYGNADTLMLNPIDLTKTSTTDQLVLSFWIRGFKQSRATDSIYLETLDNLGRWQRAWALGKADTIYKKITIALNGGRLRHAFFSMRFINKGTYSKNDTQSFAIAALKITPKKVLPLFDDFSNTVGYYPNSELWLDKNVFINNNFPKNQPSLNVATFDGLNEQGNAYSKFPIKATADVLTSKGYDLSAFSLADSIYFSFYYQYQLQGTTGQIQPTDSLYLEFRSTPNDKDSFNIIWQKSAFDTLSYDTFNRVLLALPKNYLHDDFQLRFRTIGSLSGNVSQWHIDYIKLDAGRSLKDTFYDDLAISSTPTSMLKKYRSMPWKHFELNKQAYTNDSLYYTVFNNNKRNYSVDYRRKLIDNEQSVVFIKNNTIGSVPFSVASQLISTSPAPTLLTTSSNNLVKKFSNIISVSSNGFAGNDNVPSNDSIITTTTFSNYFAYDDGSAEAGYGIYLKSNAAVALAFDLEKTDTIYGVQVFFNQSENNVSTRKFDLVVWDNISPINENATSDRVIYRKNNLTPIYTNTINGFATILFDSAIIVPKRFFVGWEQLGQFVLNVGLDENYYVGNKFVTNSNMFFKTDGFWQATEIPGALMIRPLLGQIVDVPTNVNELNKNNSSIAVNIYPNPAKNYLTIETNSNNACKVLLFDLMGKQYIQTTIKNHTPTIDLPTLSPGIYLVQIIDEVSGNKTTKKLIID